MNWLKIIYEAMGLYKKDMADLLEMDYCPPAESLPLPFYTLLAIAAIGVPLVVLLLYYHVFDSPRWVRAYHLWFFILAATIIGFGTGFFIAAYANDQKTCTDLIPEKGDWLGVGLTQAIFTFLAAFGLSFVLRHISINRRETTPFRP